jgi:hypothetical protein
MRAGLDLAIALARALLHGSGALRVKVALDAAEPAVIECERLRAIVVHGEDGQMALAHDAAGDVELTELPFMRQLPPFEVDPEEGTVAGMLGGLEMLGRAIADIAARLEGTSVVAAEYETNHPDLPLGIAGRSGEGLVVLLGEHEFELDAFPAARPSD